MMNQFLSESRLSLRETNATVRGAKGDSRFLADPLGLHVPTFDPPGLAVGGTLAVIGFFQYS